MSSNLLPCHTTHRKCHAHTASNISTVGITSFLLSPLTSTACFVGDVPIFIADVDEKGPAYRVLKVSKRIVSINGQSAHRITHNQCAQMLRTPNLDVQLEVTVFSF